jgi:peptide/nickel transport system substrate-binding protein
LTIGPACPDDVADALAVPFVKSITAPDDKTIIFTLITKTAFFRQILTSAPYVPADPNIFPADKCVLLPIAPIYGVGPWYISQYDPDEQMVFEPNPYYTGDLKPQAKEIIVRFYSDPNTMALAVQSGEIDIAWHDLFPDQLTQLKSVTNLHIGTIPSNRIHFLVLNHTMKPFDDPNVDKAVASAIDRDEIANTVFGGWVVPLYSPVPPGFLGATQAFDKMYASPNLDQAKKYLENSGYSASNPVKLELWSSSPSSQVVKDLYASMMQLIKKQLESTGDIQVDLKTPGAGEGYAIAEGKTIQAGLLGWWPDYPDPSDYLDLLVYNRGDGTNITIPAMGSLNGTPINDKAKDLVALLQQADDETELAKRADLYGQAQDVYADLVVTLPLYCDTEHVVYQSYIQGSTDFATSETLNIGPSGIFNYSLLSKTK